MQKKYKCGYRHELENLLEKRLVFYISGPNDVDNKEQVDKPKEKPIGQQRIEKYLGQNKEEAAGSLTKILDVNEKQIKDVIEQWNKLPRWGEILRTAGSVTGRVDGKNKAALNKELEDIAQKEALKRAGEIFADQETAKDHAKNALNILSYKIEASSTLIKNLDAEMDSIKNRLQIVDKANEGLNVLSRMGGKVSGVYSRLMDNNDLRNRLAQLKSMRSTTVEIKAESGAKMDVKEKKTDQIREWDGNLRALVTPHLQDENETNLFEKNLKKTILGEASLADFNTFLDTLEIPSSTERKAINSLMRYLMEGSASTRVGEWMGKVSAEDVKNYYRLQVAQVAEVNQKDSTEKAKIEALAKCKPGQEMKVGEYNFVLVRRDAPDGYLFKERGKNEMAYLNSGNPEKPVFTLKNGEKFQELELKAAGDTKSLHSIDFKFGKLLEENESENKADKSKEKSTFRQGVDAVIRKIVAAAKSLKNA